MCARLGIEFGGSNLVPDVTVLRPESSGAIWSDPADVALVVEVETPASRRFDRLLKPALYADAGIPLYWRIERRGRPLHIHELGSDTPDAHQRQRPVELTRHTGAHRPFQLDRTRRTPRVTAVSPVTGIRGRGASRSVPAGVGGQLVQAGQHAAGQVAAGERRRHRQRGQLGVPVGDAACGPRCR